MKLLCEYNPLKHETRYTLLISDFDLTTVELDQFDWALIEECSKNESIADVLLALQTIAFRLEQRDALDVGKELAKRSSRDQPGE